MSLINFPEEATEVQAAVIELRQGQRKNALKFGAFMVLLFVVVCSVFAVTLSVGESVHEILQILPN